MPNPWLIVGALVALIAAFLGGFFYGQHVEGLGWRIEAEAQKAEAGRQLAEATAKAAAAEIRAATMATEVEANHAKRQAEIDALAEDNRRLAARIVGLLGGPGGGAGGDGAMPGAPGSAPGGAGLPAAYRELSGAMADLLGEAGSIARDADREAAIATACRDWAVGVSGGGDR